MTQAAVSSAGQASRERILEAALDLFADKGLAGVTLREIGARAGLHNSSLFHHFANKVEIARAVFERVLERVLPLLEDLASEEPPSLDSFVDAITGLADHFHDARDEARFLLRAILDKDAIVAPYAAELDGSEAGHPVVRLLDAGWGWLGRARAAGVVRDLNVYQATRNLFGLVLFEPAYAYGEGASSPELYEKRRRERRKEVREFVRGALAPLPG